MAFTTLSNGNIGLADEINDNFYYIAQGDRLPMGNSTLSATTGVYDLGSSGGRWSNLFTENIDISGSITTDNASLLVKIAETELSGTSNSIIFTGLNGDDYKQIYVRFFLQYSGTVNTDTTYGMTINSNTGSGYGYQYLAGQSTAVSSARSGGLSWMIVSSISKGSTWTTTAQHSYTELILNSATGDERLALSQETRTFGEDFIGQNFSFAQIYQVTTDTITSLEFFPTNITTNTAFGIGTKITLLGRK